MSRGLSTLFTDALGGSVLCPHYFVEFQFDSVYTRFWSGQGNITADLGDGPQTWIGAAWIGGIHMSGEAEDIQARSLVFTLNGVDNSFYSTMVSTKYEGRPVKLWFTLTNDTFTAVDYYYLLEEARMDKIKITNQQETITLTLSCESRLVDLFTDRRVPMTNEELQKTPAYSTHTFYEYVATLIGKKMPWGLVAGSSGNTSYGGTGRNDFQNRP